MLILCNVLLVVCAVVELRAWAFGEGCGVCLQLGLALIVEATIGGTTIVWVSMSTTLRMQTHRALVWLPERGDPAQRRPPSRDATSNSGSPCGESLTSAGADAGAFQAHDHRSSGEGDRSSIGKSRAESRAIRLVGLRAGVGTARAPPPNTLSETPYGSRTAHSAG